MRESPFWNYLKPKLPGWWKRIESPITSGTPDLFGIWGCKPLWVELKYKDAGQFVEGLGTSGIQRNWHRQYYERGGSSFLVARIGKLILCIPGYDLDDSKGAEVWTQRALYMGTVGMDFDAEAMVSAMALHDPWSLNSFGESTMLPPKLSDVEIERLVFSGVANSVAKSCGEVLKGGSRHLPQGLFSLNVPDWLAEGSKG